MGHLDLNAAVVLVRVVQAGSFRGGARALGLPKTTVSRKVAELEEHLGARLVQRTTRTLALTDAGAAFVEQAEEALAHLEAAEQAVTELQREPRGRLRVTATTAMGQTLLAPLLSDFLEAHPAVDVVLQLTDRHVDLVAERVDVALRAGPLPDSSLVAHRVGTSTMRLVASPRYLREHGTPMTPADLAGHRCLRFAKSGEAARATWPLGRAKRVREVAITGRFVADDMLVLRAAAERGLGIARLPAVLVKDAVRRHRLVPLLEEYSTQEVPLHLVHLGGRHVPTRTRALIDFLRVKIAAELAG
jgi:DNA-binding transcriptional LysR family regulator